jgi:hypothetical protein
MSDIEKRAARIRRQGKCSNFERDWLCDTVDALRARVAELERERDEQDELDRSTSPGHFRRKMCGKAPTHDFPQYNYKGAWLPRVCSVCLAARVEELEKELGYERALKEYNRERADGWRKKSDRFRARVAELEKELENERYWRHYANKRRAAQREGKDGA